MVSFSNVSLNFSQPAPHIITPQREAEANQAVQRSQQDQVSINQSQGANEQEASESVTVSNSMGRSKSSTGMSSEDAIALYRRVSAFL